MKFLPILICAALACGRAALAQAETSTAPVTAPDASARLEERLRGAYVSFFRSGNNPEGRAAAEFLEARPEIRFRLGTAAEETSLNWCDKRSRILYTDVRYIARYWSAEQLAAGGEPLDDFIKESAAGVVHELVHMRVGYDWPYFKLDPEKLGRKPFTREWTDRFLNAEEFLAYLTEGRYVAHEMAADPGFVTARHNPAYKWRWEHYSSDLEGYCARVLGAACAGAAMADLKSHDYPEIEDFYKTLIARQQKARAAILSKLTPPRKK